MRLTHYLLLWHTAKSTILWLAGLSLPAWLLRIVFYKRYVYMGYDQARDSYIFYNISQGYIPDYGPYALSGGYAMPNYYYRVYAALNVINPADPVYQALPFVMLSAVGASMSLWLVWWLSGTMIPSLSLANRRWLLVIPFLGIGLSYNELINAPLIWNPTNLLFWQLGLFLLYIRIQTKSHTWRNREALVTWSLFGAWSVIAASMHGTFLYAIPLWALGLIGYHLTRRRWHSLAYFGGVIAALIPYLRTDSKYQFQNTRLMLGLGDANSTLQQGVNFNPLHNLWNNLSQFAHKVVFGLDAPATGWTIILLFVLVASLPLMICYFKKLRWYAWWIVIYLCMASLFGGERGDSTISWHYQQNIMLWPTLAVVVIVAWLMTTKHRTQTANASSRKRYALRLAPIGLSILVVVFAAGYSLGLQRMLTRQYHAAYKSDFELMSTYEIEAALATIQPQSTICTPVGYYHTSTFAYLREVRLGFNGDTFTDSCGGMQSGYIFIPNHHYNFWPPHRSLQTNTATYQSSINQSTTHASSAKFVIYKIKPAE